MMMICQVCIGHDLQLRPPAHDSRARHDGIGDNRTGARCGRRACTSRWRWTHRRHRAGRQVSPACSSRLRKFNASIITNTRSTQRAQTSSERQHNRIVAVLPGYGS